MLGSKNYMEEDRAKTEQGSENKLGLSCAKKSKSHKSVPYMKTGAVFKPCMLAACHW